jgi:hypothetical protein
MGDSKTVLNYSYRKIQQDATLYQNLLFHIYMKLNMFWVTHHPLSGAGFERQLSASSNHTSNNLPHTQNQKLLMQLWAPDDGWCCPKQVELHINME